MSVTYTWKIKSLKTQKINNQDGFIFQTYWTKTGTDENGNEGVFSGATPFPPKPDVPFIPLESLAEETVLDWIKAVVVGEYENHVNAQIQKSIDDKIALVADTPLPWVTVETTAEPTPTVG